MQAPKKSQPICQSTDRGKSEDSGNSSDKCSRYADLLQWTGWWDQVLAGGRTLMTAIGACALVVLGIYREIARLGNRFSWAVFMGRIAGYFGER